VIESNEEAYNTKHEKKKYYIFDGNNKLDSVEES